MRDERNLLGLLTDIEQMYEMTFQFFDDQSNMDRDMDSIRAAIIGAYTADRLKYYTGLNEWMSKHVTRPSET